MKSVCTCVYNLLLFRKQIVLFNQSLYFYVVELSMIDEKIDFSCNLIDTLFDKLALNDKHLM